MPPWAQPLDASAPSGALASTTARMGASRNAVFRPAKPPPMDHRCASDIE
jgi:hypothetical protein